MAPEHKITPKDEQSSLVAMHFEDETIENESEDSNESSDDEGIAAQFRSRVNAIFKSTNKPHDSSREIAGSFVIHHASFVKSEQLCDNLLQKGIQLLNDSPYQEQSVFELRELLESARKIPYPEPKKIGVVGESGVGKSSLINALLNAKGLASNGATGAACTCVVTEFCQPFPYQKDRFHAEIHICDRAQILKLVRNHLAIYRKFNHEYNDFADEVEREECAAGAQTAVDVFSALFPYHKEFCDEEMANDFLREATIHTIDVLASTFCEWIDNLLTQCKAEGHVITKTAVDAAEMSGLLDPYVSTIPAEEASGESRSPCLWPIVKFVRVGLYSELLAQGLILVDLPGRGDSNKIRTETTEGYIKEISYYLLTTEISRVLTDNRVFNVYQKEARRFGERMALVCTKIDNMPLGTKPASLDAPSEVQDEFKNLDQAIKTTMEGLKSVQKLQKGAKGQSKIAFKDEADQKKKRLKAYNAIKKELLVKMRNRKVVLGLCKKYQEATKDSHQMHVMCVSSEDYNSHVAGYDDDDIPLSLNVTGIPTLRHLLASSQAIRKFEIYQAHLKGTLPQGLNSMETWSTQVVQKRREEICKVVSKPHEQTAAIITKYTDQVAETLDIILLATFGLDDEQALWIEKGLQVCDEVKKMKSSAVAATCRRSGYWAPRGRPPIDWNEQLLQPVSDSVALPWNKFNWEIKKATEHVCEELKCLVDVVKDEIKNMAEVQIVLMEPFFDSLGPRKEILNQRLTEFQKELLQQSNDANYHMLETGETGTQGFLMAGMEPVYQQCRELKGKGVTKQRIALLEYAISRGDAFNLMHPGVKDLFEERLGAARESLTKQVEDVFGGMLKDFDNMCRVEETQDWQRDALRKQVKNLAVEAKEVDYPRTVAEFDTAERQTDKKRKAEESGVLCQRW